LRLNHARFSDIKVIEYVLATLEFVCQLLPAALDRCPRGFTGHLTLPERSILFERPAIFS
jgi:hypothetical protein